MWLALAGFGRAFVIVGRVSPTAGRLFSCGPPFFGAFQL